MKDLRIDSAHREDHKSGPPPWFWGAIVALIVLALGAFVAWYWLSAKPLEVQTATAQASGGASANAVLQATGYVTAQRQATVSAQITGTLTEVLIEEGDKVAKGQVLARLEDKALRAQLETSQANLKSAEANTALAQAQLAQAQADERRQGELLVSGMTTQQAAETARTAVKSDEAQLEARRRDADAAQAQVAQAHVNFDYATVRAPFAGVITAKAAQVGEIISPLSAGGGFTRTGVGTIVDMTSLEVDVDVNEAYIGQVSAAMPCEAVLDAYPDWKIPAHVIAVVPSADRGKATVKVRVAMEQMDSRVVPDMGVRVSFLAAKPTASVASAPKGVLVTPQALVSQGEGSIVFVVADGKAHQQSVKLGPDQGKFKLVTEGLKAGDTVVVAPPENLKDGMAVAAKETQ